MASPDPKVSVETRHSMPPLVYCAAAAILVSEHKDEGRKCRRKHRSASVPHLNPLLDGFAVRHMESNVVPLLRVDLQPLRRAGQPTQCNPQQAPDVRIGQPTQCYTRQVTGVQNINVADDGCGISLQTFLEAPGLSFNDYVWAKSAIRKMRIEAMYI